MVRKILLPLILIISSGLSGIAQPGDTLTAGVVEWSKLKFHSYQYGDDREVLSGNTHDGLRLEIHAYTLLPTVTFSFGGHPLVDRLVIVKEGSLTVKIRDSSKVLGPGGVGLFPAGSLPYLLNSSSANAIFYVLTFSGKVLTKRGPAPFLIDWPEMAVKQTSKGEGRQIFSRTTGLLGKIDLHATTLRAGEVSHPPHVHKVEEIILLRSGHVQEYIAGSHEKASTGDLIYLSSGIPHALENHSNTPCEYFALQWEE